MYTHAQGVLYTKKGKDMAMCFYLSISLGITFDIIIRDQTLYMRFALGIPRDMSTLRDTFLLRDDTEPSFARYIRAGY